jgi:hypothetical protein
MRSANLTSSTQDNIKLQKELVEAQVDMAISRTIDRVVDQISALREDMHELRHEMRDRFVSLETRVTAVETKLGMVNESHKEVRSRFIDYCFKAGWLILGAVVSSLALLLHQG